LLYVEHRSPVDDLRLMFLTLVALVARRLARRGVEQILLKWGVEESLRRISRRCDPLPEGRPPGLPA
jgi:hypothetical protein